MQILHGFWRIVQATSLAVFFVLFSTNAFAYEIMPIFNWSAEIDGGTVSGVARCGPGSGSTSTSAKSWGSSNWNLQNKGCFCRARDIASVDWTDVPLEYASSTEAQRSYWYGSGGSNSMYPLNSLEECEANCADKCAALFASNASYRNNLCGGNCQIDQGNTTQYTITYNLNGGTGCSNETYTGSTTLCTPTRDGYTFVGWATTDGGATVYNANANVSGTDLTLYANWTFVGCANGQYFENDTCNTCVSGYTSDGATATSQNDCYVQNTVNCYEYNPYNFGHGVPSYKNQTATCKQHYDDFICILDDSTACDILTLNCDTGYEESSVGYYMMNNINKFEKGYTCSYNREPGECSYGLEPSYSIGFFSDEASINNAVGHFVCTSVPGDPTSFQSRIVPSFEYDPTDSGAYCWAKATSIDGQSINAPWFFKKEYESAEECLQECGYAEGEELYIILNTFALSVSNKMCGAINYDIIYNLNGGEEIEPGTYTIASAIVNLPTPFKDGYDFAGWYDNEELTGDPIYSFVPDINNLVTKTFWAQWTENEETQCNNQGSPYYWDTDNGVCVNEQDECESQGSEYYWDGSTCRDAQIECESQGSEYYWDGSMCRDAQIECESQGSEYYWDDLTGECVNEQTTCENDGGYWDDMEGICCASDEHAEGGVCVPDEDPEQDCIDAGGEWDGETCTCPGGQFEDDGMCHEACTGDYVWNGESCACPDDQEDSGDGTCHETCTGDYVWNGESCTCPDGQEDSGDGTCHEACTGDYVWNGESCACPDASQNDDGNGHCCASGYGWSDTEVGCVSDCTGDYVWNGSECACPDEYTSDGTDNCYKTNTIPCSTQNPYTFGHGLPVYNNQTASCKQYYGENQCILSDSTACDISALTCDTGYEESSVGLDELLTFIPVTTCDPGCTIANTDGCINTCTGHPIPMAPGSAHVYLEENPYIDNYTSSMVCNTTAGDASSGIARINKNADFNSGTSGTHCWTKVTTINGRSIMHPWLYVGQFSSTEECAQNCGMDSGTKILFGQDYENSPEYQDGLYASIAEIKFKKCAPTTYTITYNLNGGTDCTNESYTINDNVALCEPTREGYTFDGWYDNADLNGTAITNFVPSADNLENKTFYAKWVLAAFECTSGKWLHLGDNAKLCLSETKPVSHESPVVLKVQVGNKVYYLSATPGADYLPVNEDSTGVKMKMYYKGRTYNVHDESISVF